MEEEVRPDSQVLRCLGGEGRTFMNKEERGQEGGRREGEIVDSSGGGGGVRNWDRDTVGEKNRARGIE